ncbi:DUF167 domain-containing protein [Pelotomaculum propionicicum]|uniref:DUF167 domain-containing protein n=1 Tax=Pelotomaculum propionicicum TaxID=258475 RepID=UPI003B772A07
MLHIREVDGDVYFKVRVMPRSSRDSIVGIYEDALKIRLTAAPLEGKANEACRAFLSKILGVPRSHVEIHTGETSRNKVIKVSGLSSEKVLQALVP